MINVWHACILPYVSYKMDRMIDFLTEHATLMLDRGNFTSDINVKLKGDQ